MQQLIRNDSQKISHSIYRKWEAVRRTALQILRHSGVHAGQAGKNEIPGVLIYMPGIFEKYLERVINQNGTLVEAQHQDKILEGKRSLRPDFLCLRDKKFKNSDNPTDKTNVVLDAKYRFGWQQAVETDTKGTKWDREDAHQMMAYMYYYKADKGGFIMPAHKEPEKRDYSLYGNGDSSPACRLPLVRLLPLVVPEANDYNEFVRKMHSSEVKLRQSIEDLIKIPADESMGKNDPQAKS